MTYSKKCKKCGANYDEWSYHFKFKYPLKVWCIDCINTHLSKTDKEQEKVIKYEKANKPSIIASINWRNEKSIIIAIIVIITIFSLLIAFGRDYGEKDYYPEDRPIDARR